CEVSGRRLWGLFAQRFGTAEKFFGEHFVVNYCPLVFMEESGRNATPDKLPKREVEQLFAACDAHLARVVEILKPQWLIGIGGFAFARVQIIAGPRPRLQIAQILHPSPASPAANRNWAGIVTKQLQASGVWPQS
ncbi:MAG TPA: single-stranded DNA-binding protein, partial [Methylomirabilota bacterium]|nr:single-stranded DNA-binding protein [Methylomirabilota bacterium]